MSGREMQFNKELENSNNGGSEQAISSDDEQFLVALRKMMNKEVEVMVIRTFHQVIVPIIGDLVRTIVKEEIQSVETRLMTGETWNANEITISKERHLQLKFSDEVSDPVLTGKPLKGRDGDSLKVEVVDKATGQVVDREPISSAKVEILILDASGDDNEHNWTLEKFNNRIIGEGDKNKPHFTKNIYLYLKEGVGILSNVKLGHNSNWMKSCKCRLGARIMESFKGVNVQEARTESFKVSDSRSKLYAKHYPPNLSDEVWRLDNIGRDGARRMRLEKENIRTVQDFRFLLSVNPKRLEELVRADAKTWKATVDHARKCAIDDDKMYLHYPSTESKMGVVLDAVGGLKGIINESHYAPINNLSADEKDSAHKILLSAFENWEKRTSFDDESSILQQFPYRSSDIAAPTNYSKQECSNGSGPCVSESTDFEFLASTDVGQTYNPDLNVLTPFHCDQFPYLENNMLHFEPLGLPTMEQSCGPCGTSYEFCYDFTEDNGIPTHLINHESNSLSEIFRAESPSHQQQSNARLVWPVVSVVLWALRVRKRVMALGGIHARKKQRISVASTTVETT